MILLGNFTVLTDMLVFVMWTFNTMLSVAVIILRKREPELKRPFKVPWYPIIPIISVIGGIFIVVSNNYQSICSFNYWYWFNIVRTANLLLHAKEK